MTAGKLCTRCPNDHRRGTCSTEAALLSWLLAIYFLAGELLALWAERMAEHKGLDFDNCLLGCARLSA